MKIEGVMPGGEYAQPSPVSFEITKQIWMAYALPLMFDKGCPVELTISKAEAIWEYVQKQK